jgi:hypothetical protein
MSEARADMSDVTPFVFFAHGENERAEKRARPFGRSKTRYDSFLAFRSFDLEPVSSVRERSASRGFGNAAGAWLFKKARVPSK